MELRESVATGWLAVPKETHGLPSVQNSPCRKLGYAKAMSNVALNPCLERG